MKQPRQILTLFIVLAAMTAVSAGVSTAQQAQIPPHRWDRIQFPQIPAFSDVPSPLGPIILNMNNRGRQGFAFVIGFSAESVEADEMIVRLHRIDGTILDPQPDPTRGKLSINGDVPYSYLFPWGRNVLEEAWIEMKLMDRTYWFELPYGFTRNPADPLQPDEEKRGRPSIVPAMAAMSPNDRIVPWLYVDYDLGEIQNQWRLSVEMANPFDANANVILYKPPQRQLGWSLTSPTTSIDIVETNGAILRSTRVNLHNNDDGLRRTDTFRFYRAGGGDDSRGWGTAEITVDGAKYSFTIPSSLFKYVHGTAEPYSKAMMSRHYPYIDGLSVTNDAIR